MISPPPPSETEVVALAEQMCKVGMRDCMRALGGIAHFLPQGTVGLGNGFLSLDVFVLRHPKREWSVAVTWDKDGHRRVTWRTRTRGQE